MAGSIQPYIKRIWGIAKSPELKLTDEELHLLVDAQTGKDSIKKLNIREAQALVRVLGHMKDSAKKQAVQEKRMAGNSATENQRRKIYMLAKQLGWNRPARVNGMCRRMFGINAVEWLDYQQCSKLIEALKKMADRKEDAADGRKEADQQGEKA